MRIIRKKLERMVADKCLLPKTEKYDAVHYMLNEWDGLKNIFTRGDYHLDNDLVERLNRYISLSRRNSLTVLRVAYWCKAGCHVLFARMLMQVVLKTEDIHPPKTGISVHFSGSLV